MQFVAALAIAAVAVIGFRALAFTLYTVEGTALAPELLAGDRILVNRWSYGLRTGSRDGLFRYGRILASPVERGDIVAFDNPSDAAGGIFVARCKAVAGDTVCIGRTSYLVPGRRATCAREDYYWMEALGRGGADSRAYGPVPESRIIGRVCMVLYSKNPAGPVYDGLRPGRTFLLK